MAKPPNMDLRRFGARLRELREHAHMTQEQLGAKATVNYKFIGGVERGAENPSLQVILKLAAALEVEPRALFEFEHLQAEPALRARAKRLIDAASGNELKQLDKIVRAVVR